MWLIPILVFVVMLVIDWFAAKQFHEIAKMKGHPQKKYFWWCFWIGMIGWPMVIALPDRGGAQAQKTSNIDELPEL